MFTLVILKYITCSQVVFVQQTLAHKVVCYGAPVTGIPGCCTLYPSNLCLNTSNAHSVKRIKLGDLDKPKKHNLTGLRRIDSKSKPSSLY